jgi:hypothetical protein
VVAPAPDAKPARQRPGHKDRLVGHLEHDRGVQAVAREQGAGLGEVAREAVEDPAGRAVRCGQAGEHHLDGRPVRDERSLPQQAVEPAPETGAGRDLAAEQLAAAQVRHADRRGQARGLHALADALRAHHRVAVHRRLLRAPEPLRHRAASPNSVELR